MPIRSFELPSDTLDTLRAKIERQKQAVQEISAKAGSLGTRTNSATAGGRFHPIPEGVFVCVYVLLYENFDFIW